MSENVNMDFRSKFKSCPKVWCGNDPANLKVDSSSHDPVQSRMDHRGDPGKPRVDRGGDLARQVIDKNARFAAQRIISKTNDELEQVLKRVDNIFSSYEFSESATHYRGMSSLEFINNLSDLEDIMKDQFKRHKYQDRIRIFIVGYEKICDDKLKLIQQLNEFFLANIKKNKDEIEEESVPELDFDSLRDSFNETISSSEEIVRRISEKHNCILKHYQQKKPQSKGKKKIDQALNLAKKDINRLNDNLSLLQKEMEQKEETVQQLMAQLETKNKEIQRYKASTDVAKNNSLGISRAKADIALRDDQIVKLQIQVGKLEKEMMLLTAKLADSFPKQLAPGSAKPNNGQTHQELGSTKEKCAVVDSSNDLEELAKKYELYIEESKQNHSREIEELNEYYEKEIQKLQSELEDFCSRCRKESISRAMQTIPLRYSRRVKQPPPTRKMYKMHDMQMMHLMQTYLPNMPAKTKMSKYQNDGSVTKDVSVSQSNNSPPVQKEPKPSNNNSQNTKPLKKENLAPSEPENLNAVPVNKTVVKQSKPPAVKTVSKPRGSLTGTTNLQNNSQVTTTPSSRRPSELLPASRSTRRSDAETIHIEEFADSFDLADEEKWMTVPQDHVFSRFQQYRKLTVQRMTELEDQMASNIRRTQGKVKEMKKEFVEFQTKWSQERQSLLSKIEELMKLKVEAESDVESALNRFEEFIEQHPDEDTSKNKEMKTSFISRESEDRIEPEILEKMTDDAKAMSRDSTRLSSGFVLSISNLAEIADVGSGVFPTTLLSSSSLPHMPTHKSATWSETIAELRKRLEQRKMETPAMPVVDLIQMPSMVAEDDDDDDPDLKKKLTVANGQLRDAATSPLQLEREATNKSMKTLQLLSRSGEGSVLEEFHRISKVVTSLCDNIAAMCPPEDLETSVDEVSVQPKTADEIKENITEMLHETEKQIFRLIDVNDVTQEKYTFESDANSLVILDDETSISLDKVQEASAPDLKWMATSASDVQNVDDMRQESNDPESSSTIEHLTFPGLKHQYEQLQKAYESEKQLNTEKQNYNASLFAEMQTTISTLKNELASLRTNANDILQTNQPTDATSPMILFTRLDSERNTKAMMQAISEKRINEDSCQKVLETMDEYVSLPIERLGNMVQRYIYQKNFKDINDSINRTGENENQGSEILTRMDSFQKKRLQRFNHRSAILSSERRRLADNLTDMLADLEQESGIFLIKPLFSYKSSYDPDDVYRGKRTRVYQPRRRQIAGPTPMSTFIDGFSKPNNSNFSMSVESANAPEVCLEDGIQGESKVLNGESTQPLWAPNDSTNWSNLDKRSSNKIQPNVPRLLELDVNRVTIGNNQISVNIPTAGIKSLGSGMKSSCSTRTYVNFSRHSGSHSSSLKGGRPCTPYDAVGKENSIPPVRPHSTHGRSFVSTPPLPPINVANDSKSTEGE